MAINNADMFKRYPVKQFKPVTADGCIIRWPASQGAGASNFTSATNVAINYGQQVARRRTLGNDGQHSFAVIYTSQPTGQMTIGRLFAENTFDIFDKPGWNACEIDNTIDIFFGRGATNCDTVGPTYRCKGCVVTQYSVQAEAEGLTVVDNIVIEFLQLEVVNTNTFPEDADGS